MQENIKKWIAQLEEVKENILNTLNYNGLILDDIEAIQEDMQNAIKA